MIAPRSWERAARIGLLVAGDTLIACLSLIAIVELRRHVHLPGTRTLLPLEKLPLDARHLAMFAVALLLALSLTGFHTLSASPRHRPTLLLALPLQLALLSVAGTFTEMQWPRSVFLGAPLIEALLLRLWRMAFKRFGAVRPRRVVLLGTREQLESFRHDFTIRGDERLAIHGFVSLDQPFDDPACIGTLADAAGREALSSAEEVIDVGGNGDDKRRLTLLSLRGARGFLFVPSPHEALLASERFGSVGDRLLVEVRLRGAYGIGKWSKRAFDLVAGTLLLIAASPLLIVVAVIIFSESGRPVLLRQRRLGRDGRIFRLWKFRTMHKGVKSGLATDDDERITGAGRRLRRYRLDELPQLINVVLGDMSLVGPRPEIPEINRGIVAELPHFDLRLLVPPGIAGIAQVDGEYDQSSQTKLCYDLQYLCSWSLLLDMRLLLQAVATSLSGRGV